MLEKANVFAMGSVAFTPGTQTCATELNELGINAGI
jgi:hypothetical protein